jgi:hypothetical protein
VGREARERRGATVEKDALYFLTLLTALLERRVTPRLVNIVNYDDEEVKVSQKCENSNLKFQIPAHVFPNSSDTVRT